MLKQIAHPAILWLAAVRPSPTMAHLRHSPLRTVHSPFLQSQIFNFRIWQRYSNKTVVKRQGRYDGLVALATLLEFLHVEAAVLVLVHHAEDLADALLGGVFVLG